MPQKSLTKTVYIDSASRAHNCRFNKRHRISRGDRRLVVKEGRTEIHYCVECAKRFLRTDICKLTDLLSFFEGTSDTNII